MRLQRIIAAFLLPLTVLLIFLLLFENRIVLPAWLQVAGRMHPLLLHFPVVLLVLYCIWTLFIPKKAIEPTYRQLVGDWLLLLSAVTAVATALMGLFLSKEEGYDAEALQWHKWSGVAVALIASLWYMFRNTLVKSKAIAVSLATISLAGIIFTGHQGAGITHGQNFLMAPLLPEKHEESVAIEDAIVFTHLVKPILDAKCMSCHNSSKAKGELVMESQDLLIKGGKSGSLWDSTQADGGLLLRRLHLPIEQKKHMPPQGKPQLNDEELNILNYWIKNGANFNVKVVDLPTTDTLRLLAEQSLTKKEVATYEFDAADEKTIQQLNNSNRVVFQLAIESPALGVNFYNKEFFNSEQLKELLKVKEQIVSLDCSHMPFKDQDLSTVAQFSNLHTLLLNFTEITGKTLGELKTLKNLKTLSLAGTSITKDKLAVLKQFPRLQKVSVWNTGLSIAEIEAIKTSKGKIKYETGIRTDTMVLKLTEPVFQNEEEIVTSSLPLKLKHYINGSVIRFTTDGTEPDSIKSNQYSGKETINNTGLIRAKAFKQGWISSDISERYFFKSTYKADSVILVTPPDPKYNQGGGSTLNNLEKGSLSFGDKKWLGYRNNKMEALLLFNSPKPVKNVTVSVLRNTGGYLMPPVLIEVWGGSDPKNLKLLGRLQPTQPQKHESSVILPFEINFAETSLSCIKVVAVPVPKLPPWHNGKGEKGWVFVDEILVN